MTNHSLFYKKDSKADYATRSRLLWMGLGVVACGGKQAHESLKQRSKTCQDISWAIVERLPLTAIHN